MRGYRRTNDVPATLRQMWRQCGGDDNFEAPGKQQYFNNIGRLPALNAPLPKPLDQALVEILPEAENEVSDFEAEFDDEAEAEKMETDDSCQLLSLTGWGAHCPGNLKFTTLTSSHPGTAP